MVARKKSGRELAAALRRIVEAELEKPAGEIDADKAGRYLELLSALESAPRASFGSGERHMAKEVKKLLREEKRKPASAATRPRFKARPAVALAAALLLAFGLFTAAAGETPYSYVRRLLAKSEPGTVVEQDGKTFIRGGKLQKYNTIEEALAAQGIGSVLIPAYWPEEHKISKIYYDEDDTEIIFQTDSPTINLSIKPVPEGKEITGLEELEHGGHTFFIAHIATADIFKSYSYIDGYEYSINYPDYDELVKIIKGLKENGK